jgi:electron transfer DM13
LAVFVATALGGLAAGIVLSRGDAESALAQGPPGVLASGSFKAIGWGTSGTATVVRERSGQLKLRFSKRFATQRAPELFVYLAKYAGERRTLWKEVAPLRRAWGPQEYDLPSNAAIRGASVTIFCAKCNKAWGAARLEPTGSSS